MSTYKNLQLIFILIPIFCLSQNLEIIYKLNYKSKKEYYYKLVINDNNSDFYMVKNNLTKIDSVKENNKNLIIVKRGDILKVISHEPELKVQSEINPLKKWNLNEKHKNEESFELFYAENYYNDSLWKCWYTKDIQISDGPFIFKNLPGLVYEISDEKNNFKFSLVSIKKIDSKIYNLDNKEIKSINLEKLKKYKTTQKDKDNILINKMLDIVKLKDFDKSSLITFDPLMELF